MSDELKIDLLIGDSRRRSDSETKEISAEKLKQNLEKFTKAIGHSFESLAQGVEGARLEQVTVQVTVGAEGSVKLLGTGGSAKAEGTISLTYKFDEHATK